MSKLWWWGLAVVSVAVGLLWVLPVSVRLSGSGEVLPCESILTTAPDGVDSLLGFGFANAVVANVSGGEDSDELPLWARLGTQRACDVERENRQTALFMTLGVGATALVLTRQRAAKPRSAEVASA